MSEFTIPKFGPLSGVKVVVAAFNTAGPFAASMMADYGAEVIIIESPLLMDQYRTTDSYSYLNKERRNFSSLVLDVVNPEGQEVFLKLMEDTDIFIEASKAGTWDKRGLTDEVLWTRNPKLVICHVTGFGLTGDPEYLARGSYDPIGQAFSGYMALNGEPDGPPMAAPAYVCDYMTAVLASWSCLAAYINALKTGKGESIDCAQYEANMLFTSTWPLDLMNYGIERKRAGAYNPTFAASGSYKCKDGAWIYVFFISTPSLKKGLPLLGFEWGTEDFPKERYFVPRGTPQGDLVEKAMIEFCASRTAEEAEKELNAHAVTAQIVLTYDMMPDHPHYKARGTFIEWEAFEGGKVKGPAPAPRFKNFPSKIWRRAPHYGEDNERLLNELGYTQEQVKELYDKGLLKQDLDDARFIAKNLADSGHKILHD